MVKIHNKKRGMKEMNEVKEIKIKKHLYFIYTWLLIISLIVGRLVFVSIEIYNDSVPKVSITEVAPIGQSPSQTEPTQIAVYVTESGKKYHTEGCRYLSKSKIYINLDDAIVEGYEPCSGCNPPTE
ncbi:MAG: hypothetical protein ACJAX4_001770 [Clostridium sp.]